MDTVPVKFAASLMALKVVGDPCEKYFGMNSLIYDTRNQIAQTAIREEIDRVLWLDSDMEFEPDLMERLSARIDEGREFVTGLYVSRKEPIRPTIFRSMEILDTEEGRKAIAPTYEDYPESEVFEIDACGFGIVMTTVKLLKDVTEAYGLPFTPVFGYGEDLSFCMRARELGYKIWCDSSIKLGHIGMKVYTVADRRKYPPAEEQFKAY
jgi:GT2 family glycosyltransferase